MGFAAVRGFGRIGAKGGSKILGPISLALDIIDCGCKAYKYHNAKKLRKMAEADARNFEQEIAQGIEAKKRSVQEAIDLQQKTSDSYLEDVQHNYDETLRKKRKSLEEINNAFATLQQLNLEATKEELEQEFNQQILERKQKLTHKLTLLELELQEKKQTQKLMSKLKPIIQALDVIVNNYQLVADDYTEFDGLFEKYRKVNREFIRLCNQNI